MQSIATTNALIWSQPAGSGYTAPSRENIQFLKHVGAWAEAAGTSSVPSLLSPLPPVASFGQVGAQPGQPRSFDAVFADAVASI